MADKPWSIAFIGAGPSTAANVKDNLDDWLPHTLEYLTLPERIGRSHKGLKEVHAWLSDEVGEDALDRVDSDDIVETLTKHRQDGLQVVLIYVPAIEDDPALEIVRAALAADIKVLDLNAGLDEYALPAAPEAEEEKPAPRRRGTPRTTTSQDSGGDDAPPVPDDPPWDTDAQDDTPDMTTEEIRAKAKGIAGLLGEPKKTVDFGKLLGNGNAVAPPAPASGGVQVTLSQQTIDLLIATFTSLGQDVAGAVSATLPQPKAAKYNYFVSEDGEYRRVVSRGRPKSGETKVELTIAELRAIKEKQPDLELPEE